MTDEEHKNILKAIMWSELSLDCDRCQDRTAFGSPAIAADADLAAEVFVAQGWQSIGDKIYCPLCAGKALNQSNGKKK